MDDLKPCPFCGSNELRICKAPSIAKDLQTFEMVPNRIECLNCGADGPAYAFVNDIIKTWNERIDG